MRVDSRTGSCHASQALRTSDYPRQRARTTPFSDSRPSIIFSGSTTDQQHSRTVDFSNPFQLNSAFSEQRAISANESYDADGDDYKSRESEVEDFDSDASGRDVSYDSGSTHQRVNDESNKDCVSFGGRSASSSVDNGWSGRDSDSGFDVRVDTASRAGGTSGTRTGRTKRWVKGYAYLRGNTSSVKFSYRCPQYRKPTLCPGRCDFIRSTGTYDNF
jgi:hypothetical protein